MTMTLSDRVSAQCDTCRFWSNRSGLCHKQSGRRSAGGISWHQTVTTEARDTCVEYQERTEDESD